jgi:hypothetical protein
MSYQVNKGEEGQQPDGAQSQLEEQQEVDTVDHEEEGLTNDEEPSK